MCAYCRVGPIGHDVLRYQPEGYQDRTEGRAENEKSGCDAGRREPGAEAEMVGERESVTG